MAALLLAPAAAQEPPPARNQPASRDAAVVQGFTADPAQFQLDNSLSLLLKGNLVSSNDLGVEVAELAPALRSQLSLSGGAGLVVMSAPEGSPGAKAGIQAHDVLLKVGDDAVGNTEQLAEALKKFRGQPLKIELLRQGKPLTVEATPKTPWVAEIAVADLPLTAWSALDVNVQHEPRYRIGVVLSEADETLRAQVGLAAGEGLIVTEVFPETPATKAGIQAHDVLLILDGKRLTTVEAINTQIQEIQDREVELKLLRGGKELSLKVTPQKESHQIVLGDAANLALTIWHAGRCPGQAQSHNCRSCHADPVSGLKHGESSALRDYHALHRLWAARQPAPAGSPQEQVNQLKEQLAKVQETLAKLEAALAPAADDAKQEKKEE